MLTICLLSLNSFATSGKELCIARENNFKAANKIFLKRLNILISDFIKNEEMHNVPDRQAAELYSIVKELSYDARKKAEEVKNRWYFAGHAMSLKKQIDLEESYFNESLNDLTVECMSRPEPRPAQEMPTLLRRYGNR